MSDSILEGTFTLEKAHTLIRPHIEHLSFKRLGDYVNNVQFQEVVDHREISFTSWLGHLMMPGCLNLDRFVYAIPIRLEAFRGSNKKIFRIEQDRFLLERQDAGDLTVGWFFQRTLFVPAWQNHDVTFYSKESNIKSIDSEKAIHLPTNYLNPFLYAVDCWAEESIAARQKSIDDLEGLRSKISLEY